MTTPAARTVTFTFTQPGTTWNGGSGIKVLVLRGATEVGGAASNNPFWGTARPQTHTLVPNAAGSLPVWARGGGDATPNPTQAQMWAGNTLLEAQGNGSFGVGFAFGYYSDPVVAGTAVTYGVNISTQGYNIAGWEARRENAAVPVTIDASTPPAGWQWTTTQQVSSPAFAAPPGSLLVALICTNNSGTSGVMSNRAITDSLGLTWTFRSEANPTNNLRYSGIATALIPGAPPVPTSGRLKVRHQGDWLDVSAGAVQFRHGADWLQLQ